MTTLLQLPVELRLKIYSMAISSLPNVIHVDEGATSREPPRSSLVKSLAAVDDQLSADMLPLYWSGNVFESYLLSGMGHYIATDWTFHRWLREIVKDAVVWIRHLRFKGSSVTPLEAHDCFWTVDVDLRRTTILVRTKDGRKCTCEHGEDLALRLLGKVRQIPIVDGQVTPNLPALWDIFDCWYTYHTKRDRPQRSFEEFERQNGHYGP